MANNITYESNQYQIPRGRVFFNPNDTNGNPTGERYIGNCPGFSLSIETEKVEHYSSESGISQKDFSQVVKITRTGTLSTDNMSSKNIALFMAGEEEAVSQASSTVTDEPISAVMQGRFYQLGQTTNNPAGARNVAAVVITDDAVTPQTFVLGDDYELDTALGRIRIVEGGAIQNSANLKASYTKPATTWQRIKTGSKSELTGAFRIVSDSPAGENRDYYMPLATLAPNGEIPIITESTDVAAMSFDIEVLKPTNAEAIYIDGRPAD
jgi:hypothetical protein